MALPKNKKKIADISAAVQKAAGVEEKEKAPSPAPKTKPAARKKPTAKAAAPKKTGRPSPRSGNTERFTLLLSEETSERLTMAFATEQIKRRKKGEKIDKSLLIEEMIVAWLNKNKF